MTYNVCRLALFLCASLQAAAAGAADSPGDSQDPAVGADAGAKELSGMSILGNSEAPKSLVIVPWKTSDIGDGIGVANMLDQRAQPVDKDVFVRELDFYELRTHAPGRGGVTPAAQPIANSVGKQQAYVSEVSNSEVLRE